MLADQLIDNMQRAASGESKKKKKRPEGEDEEGTGDRGALIGVDEGGAAMAVEKKKPGPRTGQGCGTSRVVAPSAADVNGEAVALAALLPRGVT